MLYPVLQDPLHPIVSSLFDRPRGASIGQMLFGAGEQGGWYDVSDMSTLFQDAAGTTPVTAVEQPVGRILDKSGRGNHATQATTTKRPTLKQDANGCYYLSFDGVDDAMQTGNIDFTGTDKMTVWAGVTKLSDAAAGIVAELSPSQATNIGSFYLAAPYSAAPNVGFLARGTVNTSLPAADATWAAPASLVATGQGLIGGATPNILRTTGKPERTIANSIGTGNYGNYPLYIGARAGTSIFFNGRLYSLILRGAQSSISEIEAGELYTKQKMRLP